MLRRKSPSDNSTELGESVAQPGTAEPFVLGHGLAGVHFYALKETFYLPYGALQTMRLSEESLTLVFATDEVGITGRGLHALYVHLADQRVKRVHEQGERYRELSEAPVFVERIERRPRSVVSAE